MRTIFLNKPTILLVGSYLLLSVGSVYQMLTCSGMLCSIVGFMLLTFPSSFLFDELHLFEGLGDYSFAALCFALNVMLITFVGVAIHVLLVRRHPPYPPNPS